MSSSEVTSYSFLYAASLNLASTTFIGGVSWGVMTSLYVVCMYSLMRKFRSSGDASRRTILLAGWITIMWILSSISTITNAYCEIYAFSWEMNYAGGPVVYLASEWNQSVPSLVEWTYSLTMWFADGLVVSLATCRFLPWGSSFHPRLGCLFRISALYWHDWYLLFHIDINQCESNTVFKTCHESHRSCPFPIYGLERLCDGVHLDPTAPIQAVDEENSGYLVTAAFVASQQT
ncbi:hypothetical protein OG21DRAFT_1513639, partial [Imleria badia]